jgi:hypothetical protein
MSRLSIRVSVGSPILRGITSCGSLDFRFRTQVKLAGVGQVDCNTIDGGIYIVYHISKRKSTDTHVSKGIVAIYSRTSLEHINLTHTVIYRIGAEIRRLCQFWLKKIGGVEMGLCAAFGSPAGFGFGGGRWEIAAAAQPAGRARGQI